MYRLLADSGCSGGPCPNVYRDDETGDIIVQGYKTTARPSAAPPDEGFLHIPATAWKTLLANLPK